MEIFLLYLWTRLDTVNLLLILGTLILGIATFTLFMVKMFASDYERRKEEYTQAMKVYKPAKYTFFILMLFAIAIPSKEDVTIIAGGWLAKEIITDPKTKEIGSKIYQIINKKLDEQLKVAK